MMREVDPLQTSRAQSWKLYANAPMPMVTLFRTFDITNLGRLKEKGRSLNMLLCYCIGAAASACEEFYLLPAGQKMLEYEHIGVNVIVANANGGINSCDIPFTSDLDEFDAAYQRLTAQCAIPARIMRSRII